MNEETFAHLLRQHEDETLDFKQELPSSSDLAVLITAFYNTRGGKIVIGVDDARVPVGLARPQSVETGVVNIIRDRLDLDIPPTIEIVAYQGKEFVVVTCPKGIKRPYFIRGEVRPYIRIGSSKRIANAERFIYRNTRTGHRVIGFEGIDYPEYPKEAVREALVNAVIHRDYSSTGQSIRVFIFDDRIEVHSPGGLLPDITIEQIRQLKSRSVLRNRIIVEVFRDLGGFIEKLGTGIRRMTAAMEQRGLTKPQFEELSGEFVLTLFGPGEMFMQEVQEEIPDWMKGLNERQIKVMGIIAKQEKITNKEYREQFAVSDSTALNDLNDLVKNGLLITIGSRRGRFYKLAENSK